MPPSNPAQENWTGHILTPPEAKKISGIDEVWDARLLDKFLSTLIPQSAPILAADAAAARRRRRRRRGGAAGTPTELPMDVASTFARSIAMVTKGEAEIHMISRGRPAEYRREIDFASKLAARGPDRKGCHADVQRREAREVATRDGDPAARRGHHRRGLPAGVRTGDAGTWEYELQAQFEFTFLRRNAHWGYPCIVASGVNATTLHYETKKDQIKAGDLLLMDDAAEFDGYSVDVTRTIPASGKYTKEQAEIYRMVWDAQQAAFKVALPGHTVTGGPTSVQGAANEVFKQGLFKMGLITDVTAINRCGIWFNHGIGHGIGLNVHDRRAAGNCSLEW